MPRTPPGLCTIPTLCRHATHAACSLPPPPAQLFLSSRVWAWAPRRVPRAVDLHTVAVRLDAGLYQATGALQGACAHMWAVGGVGMGVGGGERRVKGAVHLKAIAGPAT